MISTGRRVVVGVDDDDNCLIALDAAAAEAALRRLPLHVVHADPFATAADTGVSLGGAPGTAPRTGPSGAPGTAPSTAPGTAPGTGPSTEPGTARTARTAGPPPEEPRQEPGQEPGRRWVDRAMRRAVAGHPHLTVTGEVARGFPQPVLIEASRDAELVVIGDRGLGALARALTETVAGGLVLKASCPVLVTRGRGDPDGPIAVGVDGSADSQAAIGFAFAEADLRGRRLAMVHAWTRWEPPMLGTVLPIDSFAPAASAASVRSAAERLVSEASAGWCEKYPDVAVSEVLVHGHPRHALTEAGEGASLMVVGARGRTSPLAPGFGSVTGLGSVSRHLVYRAPCPVVVVSG